MIKPVLILTAFIALIVAFIATLIWLAFQILDKPIVREESMGPGPPSVIYDGNDSDDIGKPPSTTPKTDFDQTSVKANSKTKTPRGRSQPFLVTFKKPGGEVAFTLKSYEDHLHLCDRLGNILVRISVTDEERIQFLNAERKLEGSLRGSFPRYKVTTVDDSEWSEFRRQSDGDWKLKSSDGLEVCRIGKRDYGWKIEDGSENVFSRIKVDSGRVSLRDHNGQVLYYTNDTIDSLSVVPFGMPKLTRGQAAALYFALVEAEESGVREKVLSR